MSGSNLCDHCTHFYSLPEYFLENLFWETTDQPLICGFPDQIFEKRFREGVKVCTVRLTFRSASRPPKSSSWETFNSYDPKFCITQQSFVLLIMFTTCLIRLLRSLRWLFRSLSPNFSKIGPSR